MNSTGDSPAWSPRLHVRNNAFLRLCETLAAVSGARSRPQKAALFADYLKSLDDTGDLVRAVCLAANCSVPGESGSGRVTSSAAGHRTVALAASDFCGIDYQHVFRPCREATGSASEAIQKLMANMPIAIKRRKPVQPSLRDVMLNIETLASSIDQKEKIRLLQHLWQQMTPVEIRYVIPMLQAGRTGSVTDLQTVLDSIALAFDADPAAVRQAHLITRNPGTAALMAKRKELDSLLSGTEAPKTITLTTLVMYAHSWTSGRSRIPGELTLGVRVDEDPRYTEQFIPIGKADVPDDGRLKDEEMSRLSLRIRELAADRFGSTVSLKPGIVVETECETLQPNRRTKAGLVLHLPRIRSILWDAAPSDTHTLGHVERLRKSDE
ncbi:hypothetical protein QA596_09425 [Balneolales bacterium ANBcel1]|nr:hypothetical protein [Balneolales bacterium ANBcel1]